MHGATPNLLDWSTTGNGSGGQAWYDLAIAVSPVNKEELLSGRCQHLAFEQRRRQLREV